MQTTKPPHARRSSFSACLVLRSALNVMLDMPGNRSRGRHHDGFAPYLAHHDEGDQLPKGGMIVPLSDGYRGSESESEYETESVSSTHDAKAGGRGCGKVAMLVAGLLLLLAALSAGYFGGLAYA
eukprot:3140373-Pleurochrysis_carterae.AAC.3